MKYIFRDSLRSSSLNQDELNQSYNSENIRTESPTLAQVIIVYNNMKDLVIEVSILWQLCKALVMVSSYLIFNSKFMNSFSL